MGTLYNKYSYWGVIPPTLTSYNWIVLIVGNVKSSSAEYVSLSEIAFCDNNGNAFQFPAGTVVYASTTIHDAENLIDNDPTTDTICTWSIDTAPCTFYIYLPVGKYIDIGTYNTFKWYTSEWADEESPITWAVVAYENAYDPMARIMVNREINYNVTTMIHALAYTGTLSQVSPITYKYIKLHISATNGSKRYMQLSKIVFGNDFGTLAYPSGTTCTGSLPASSSSEDADKLIDGSTSTKYCCSWLSNRGCDIIITFPTGSELDVTQYTYWSWYTANDDATRDPTSWQLYGANQSDFSDAVLLDSITNFSPTSTRKAFAYGGSVVFPITT